MKLENITDTRPKPADSDTICFHAPILEYSFVEDFVLADVNSLIRRYF